MPLTKCPGWMDAQMGRERNGEKKGVGREGAC